MSKIEGRSELAFQLVDILPKGAIDQVNERLAMRLLTTFDGQLPHRYKFSHGGADFEVRTSRRTTAVGEHRLPRKIRLRKESPHSVKQALIDLKGSNIRSVFRPKRKAMNDEIHLNTRYAVKQSSATVDQMIEAKQKHSLDSLLQMGF